MIESESKILPLISKALVAQAKEEAETQGEAAETAKNRPLDEKKLGEIIRDAFPEAFQ